MPSARPCASTRRTTWPRPAPAARRSPSSRMRSTTVIASVLRIRNAAVNSAMAASSASVDRTSEVELRSEAAMSDGALRTYGSWTSDRLELGGDGGDAGTRHEDDINAGQAGDRRLCCRCPRVGGRRSRVGRSGVGREGRLGAGAGRGIRDVQLGGGRERQDDGATAGAGDRPLARQDADDAHVHGRAGAEDRSARCQRPAHRWPPSAR